MTTANNTTANNNGEVSIKDLLKAKAEEMKSKTYGKSEVAKLQIAMNKEIAVVNEVESDLTKGITGLEKKKIQLAMEAQRLEIKEKYEPQFEALGVDIAEITVHYAVLGAEKAGKAVKPVTKALKKGIGAFFKSAGLAKDSE